MINGIQKLSEKFRSTLESINKGESLKARALRGSSWLAIGSGAEQGLRLVRNMLLTRLLLPEVFGVMAIIFVVNVFFQSFTEIGLREAIIQNPDGDKDTYLNAVWWLSFARSSVLYIIAYFCAPFIAKFYNNFDLVQMLRIAFLSLLFRGLLSPKAYVCMKRMDFKKWIAVEQTGGIIGILTAIVLAYIYRNVWALVLGFVVESFAQFFLSYIICPFVPRLHFEKEHSHALFKFARGMLGLPILTFIYMKLDVFFIGKLRTTKELGLYNMAANLARIPSLFMEKFISPLFMPAFSEIQDDNERIHKSILDISTVFAFIGVPLIAFVFFYAKPILSIIYTPQYAKVSVSFSLLFTATMIQNFTRPIVAVYLSKGKPGLLRTITGLRAFLVAALMYPAIHFQGLEGAASAVLISMLTLFVILVIGMERLIGLKTSNYLTTYFGAIIFSSPIVLIKVLLLYAKLNSLTLNLFIGLLSLIISYILIKLFIKVFRQRIKRLYNPR